MSEGNAMLMEDWLRGCVKHDGRNGEVTLPCDRVLEVANYIEKTRTPQWIPCGERLPVIKEYHVSDPCVVYCIDGACFFAELEENIFGQVGWSCAKEDDCDEVIAWMPLPEPDLQQTCNKLAAGERKEEKGRRMNEEMVEANEREEILFMAKDIVNGKKYGTVEDNFGIISDLWSMYLQRHVNPKDVAVMMILLKIARIRTGESNTDNWVDIAGYAACGGSLGN